MGTIGMVDWRKIATKFGGGQKLAEYFLFVKTIIYMKINAHEARKKKITIA